MSNNRSIEQGIKEFGSSGVWPRTWKEIEFRHPKKKEVGYYGFVTDQGKYFLKVFKESENGAALAEEKNSRNLFEKQKGWLSPEIILKQRIKGSTVLVYPFIEGENFYDKQCRQRNEKGNTDTSEIMIGIRQISALATQLNQEKLEELHISEYPFPPTFRLINELTPNQNKLQTTNRIEEQLKLLATLIDKRFSGYYFDRHPKNMIINSNGLYQIDPERVCLRSPVFDLSMYLNTGYDPNCITVPDIVDIEGSSRKKFLETTNLHNLKQTEESLEVFAATTSHAKIPPLVYEAASMLVHIHFLKYPLVGIQRNEGTRIKPRHWYHLAAALEIIENLQLDEKLEKLGNHLTGLTMTRNDLEAIKSLLHQNGVIFSKQSHE
jgi:thiamine kinase-like enzyme